MTDFLLNIITHPAFSAVTFFAGLLLGNHLSLFRDRRKEFNGIAVPITIALLRQVDILKRGGFVQATHFVTDDDFNLLEIHLSKRGARKYKKDLAYYKQCEETCGHWDAGGWKIDSLEDYIKATYTMLSYAKKK
jgi:hypothetical protein